MITLSQCCCGCSLRTGTLILGWLAVVASLLGVILFSLNIVNVNDVVVNYMINSNVDLDRIDAVRLVILVGLYVYVVFYAAYFVSSIYLIIGVNKKRHRFLFQWVVISAIGGILLFLWGLLLTLVSGASLLTVLFKLIFWCISAAIQIYFMLVVYSLFKEMRDENNASKNVVPLQPAEPLMPPTYPSYNKA